MNKSLPTYIVTNGERAQNNYKKLKGENSFIWSIPYKAKKALVPDTTWLVINKLKKEALLLYSTEYEKAVHGSSMDSTIVDGIELEGDMTQHGFLKSDILETYKLSDSFALPILGPGTGSTTYDIFRPQKTSIIEIRSRILKEIPKKSKLALLLAEAEKELELDDCVAYKEKNRWGFLFYKKLKNGEIEFNFIPVNNFDEKGNKLKTHQEGFKDFVYFIESVGHPKAIKIGRTDNPTKRYKQIDGSNPSYLKMMIVIPDGRKEKMYHKDFADYLIYKKKEWFYDDQKIREFINKENNRYEVIKQLYEKKQKETKSCKST